MVRGREEKRGGKCGHGWWFIILFMEVRGVAIEGKISSRASACLIVNRPKAV